VKLTPVAFGDKRLQRVDRLSVPHG
jgi:hypothetical protein